MEILDTRQSQFWNHYDDMIQNGHNETVILNCIQNEFLSFNNSKEFHCHSTSILYKLFLNAVFEEFNFPFSAEMKSINKHNEYGYIVYCDDLTEDIQTALRIMW